MYYFLVLFSFLMLLTPTVQQHEKIASVANKKKTRHDMSVSVSVSLNFKMSQQTTFPTKSTMLTYIPMNCSCSFCIPYPVNALNFLLIVAERL